MRMGISIRRFIVLLLYNIIIGTESVKLHPPSRRKPPETSLIYVIVSEIKFKERKRRNKEL